jgi:hypothetical protein
MENYIQNPISHQDWNPEMGDFFSERVYEEDRNFEKKQMRKKILVSGLISIHMIMLAFVFFYFS